MAERRAVPAAAVVLLGLATTGLVAVAADQPWMRAVPRDETAAALSALADPTPQVPLTLALALVALAAWGVLLVTRGRVRRGVAGLLLAATLGSTASTVAGWWLLPDQLRTSPGLSGLDVDLEVQGWYAVALAAGLLALAPAAVALVQVPRWPEMGRRYDAPLEGASPPARSTATATAAAGATAAASGEQDATRSSNLDLWKSIDEGHDPTS